MAKNANNPTSIQTDDLVLTGRPVLVQNNLGIFYGFLEKADTRDGTALLSNGFMLSPDCHITFAQYLDFIAPDIEENYLFRIEQLNDGKLDEKEGIGEGPNGEPFNVYDSLIPDEVIINESIFNEHKRKLSITDYASEGVFMVQHRTSTHENSTRRQSYAPLISLTKVVAIVTLSESPVTNSKMSRLYLNVLQQGVLGNSRIEYYQAINPIFTFGRLYAGGIAYMILEAEDSIKTELNKSFEHGTPAIDNLSKLYKGIFKSVVKQLGELSDSDTHKRNIKSKPRNKTIHDFLQFALDMPDIVINSEERVRSYTELKKFQDNDQDK